MAGVLSIPITMCARPRGHGYMEAVVDRANPFFEIGCALRGHEFHYSSPEPAAIPPATAFKVLRGTGAFDGRDGICRYNVLAAYLHLHAAGCPEWAQGVVRAAHRYEVMRNAKA